MISICKQFFQALFEKMILKSACFSYFDFKLSFSFCRQSQEQS